jgi:1-acyl-sn-glycerol-3-phosphate acyltransferase
MTTATLPEENRRRGEALARAGRGAAAVALGLMRAAGFAAIVAAAVAELAWLPARRRAMARPLWLQRLCRRLVRLLDLRVQYRGDAAASGVLVFNHVSYLDVVVLGARHPVLFVAKKEVRSWPLIGWLAAQGGTIFIDRARRADVARVGALMTAAVRQGVRVCIFPEGTSTDGSRVLPFRTSLLEPIAASQCPVTAGWIGYAIEEGRAELEVCYWGEMNFATHFAHLLTKRRISAAVAYAAVAAPRADRRLLGRKLHSVVSGLSPARE